MLVNIDLTHLIKNLKHYSAGFENALSEGLQDAAEQGAQVARTQIGYTPRGNPGLRERTVAYKNSALDQGIIANTPYAAWVEYGNGPPGSKIYPRKSSCLHFFSNGEEVFVKWVKASVPHPFMANALTFEQGNAADIVAKHIHNFLRG